MAPLPPETHQRRRFGENNRRQYAGRAGRCGNLSQEDFTTNAQNIADVFEKQRLTDPALSVRDAITYFSGIRAATYEEDFVVRKGRRTNNLVHAAGIQSPGITGAPAIAQDVSKMATELSLKQKKLRRTHRSPDS